jgi:hypothetical protein
MQRINSEKERRVTAKVRGIVKPMNKTYGGSILKRQDMLEATRRKFELFLSNLNVPED